MSTEDNTNNNNLTKPSVSNIDKSKDKRIFYKGSNCFLGSKFEGRIEELESYVYNYVRLCEAELYFCTNKEVADYFSKHLKHFGNNIKKAILLMELPKFDKPADKHVVGVHFAKEADLRIREKEMDNYLKLYVKISRQLTPSSWANVQIL